MEGDDSVVANGPGDGRPSSLTGRSPMTNSEESVLDTVGIRDDSSSELDWAVEGREIESSPELTIDDDGGTTVTSRRSDSRSRLALDIVGLSSEGGSGTDSGVMSGKISDSEGCNEGTSVGVFGGGVGALSTGRSMTNERGVLASEGIVLHKDAVSNWVSDASVRSHSQSAAVTNSVSVSVLHFSAVTYSDETSEAQGSTVWNSVEASVLHCSTVI